MKFYHIISNSTGGYYWRPEGRGYTSEINEAGVFTEDESAAIIQRSDKDRRIEADIISVIAHFRKQLDACYIEMNTTEQLSSPVPIYGIYWETRDMWMNRFGNWVNYKVIVEDDLWDHPGFALAFATEFIQQTQPNVVIKKYNEK